MRGKCLFGPVWSRRLGRSLGINLTPYKTCNLDCVYCECGFTTILTVERREHIATETVIESLARYRESARFRANPPSSLTFAGFGEPTLHSGLGEIVRFVKRHFPENRLALITNGTLFGLYPELLDEVQGVDLIIPSLDAGREETFETVNRPHPALDFERYVEGLLQLRERFRGEMWLEVFLVKGLNDTEAEVEALRKHISRLAPHRVHLNSVDRPPAEEWVQAPSPERLREIAQVLRAEIIVSPPPSVLSSPCP
ncbi:MAG: radical SAM protein [Candidatus Caldatribacteriaceae bacterium]